MQDVERGKDLATLRVRRRLTQRQVGAAFDPPIDKSAISEWERGLSNPELYRLPILDDLYGGTGEVWELFGAKPAVTLTSLDAKIDRVIRLLEERGGNGSSPEQRHAAAKTAAKRTAPAGD